MARLSSIIILSVTAVLFNLNLYSQEIPHSVSNYGIYDFLDELANNQIISVNSAVKPYSRLDIAKLLEEADGRRELLTPRQMKELEFYLLDFGKELNGATVLVAKRRFRDSGSLELGILLAVALPAIAGCKTAKAGQRAVGIYPAPCNLHLAP